MATNWSQYQQDVFNFVEHGKGSAVISAVAGSGKTTTIVECAKRIPSNKSVLFLAFNKNIATELGQRLAPYRNVECCTLHSYGFRAIRKALGTQRANVKYTKYRDYIANNISILSGIVGDESEESIKRSYIYNVTNLLNMCRINLVQKGETDKITAIAEHHSIDLFADEVDAVSILLETCYHLSDNNIDFCDQITMPCTTLKRFCDKYDYVFVDECQDLSKAQRELMLLALKKDGRFIAVGDRKQAINGFAGAGCDSFDLLAEIAKKELPLSVNYRCGSKIIDLAQIIVPQIQAHEGAICGEIYEVEDFNALKGGDMILCRKTAPLIRLCLKMITNNMAARVKGQDIGKGLVTLIERLKPKNIMYLYDKLDAELDRIKKHAEAKGIKNVDNCVAVASFKDKVECISAFAETCSGIAELKRKIEYVFSDTAQRNGITLSTVHKSKGLENERVFIILPNKLPLTWKGQQEWEWEQEQNLKYVAITRAKSALYFVNLDEDQLAAYDFKKR